MSWLAPNRAALNKVATVPAPTGGLNARDSLANMPETDAIVLSNWWPEPYGLSVRPGTRLWSIVPFGSGCLATWSSPDGDTKMFAMGEAAGTLTGAIYDVTTRMAPGSPELVPVYTEFGSVTPFTLQTVNDAGAHLFFVPDTDTDAVVYNIAGFTKVLYDVGPVPTTPADYTWYDGPGVATRQMTSHQGRLWATDTKSSVGWYLPVDAIFGGWAAFDFGPQFTLGGGIAFLATWTIDDGNGAEDHLVAVSSEGQAVVYGGSNPEDSTSWQLVGVYTIGKPVNSLKGYTKVGGDLIILTQRGLVSMASLLLSTRVNEAVNAVNSSKVQLIISDAVLSEPTGFSWQLFYYAADNLFILNLPVNKNPATPVLLGANPILSSTGQRQLATNLVIKDNPWTSFSGMPAVMWVTTENNLFFGTTTGQVLQAWTEWTDNVGLDNTGGTQIKTQVQQAYTYFGSPAVQKQVGMYRPGFLVQAKIAYGSVIEYDFLVRKLRIPSAGSSRDFYSFWDEGIWDAAVWAGGIYTDRRWIMADGVGTAISLRMSMQSNSNLLWVATDYSYKVGTLL